MEGKPHLEIEIDEHSADVGAITRLEAFLDSLKNAPPKPQAPRVVRRRNIKTMGRKVFIPPMTDHSVGIAAAFRACGGEAEVMPESDARTLELGRKYTSGQGMLPLRADHRRHAEASSGQRGGPGQDGAFHAFGHRALPFRPVPPFPPHGPGRAWLRRCAHLRAGTSRKNSTRNWAWPAGRILPAWAGRGWWRWTFCKRPCTRPGPTSRPREPPTGSTPNTWA